MNWITESRKKKLAGVCLFCHRSYAIHSNIRLAHKHTVQIICVFLFLSFFFEPFFHPRHLCLRWSWLSTQYVCIFRFSTNKIYHNTTSMFANMCVNVCAVFRGIDLHPGNNKKRERDLTISKIEKKNVLKATHWFSHAIQSVWIIRAHTQTHQHIRTDQI